MDFYGYFSEGQWAALKYPVFWQKGGKDYEIY